MKLESELRKLEEWIDHLPKLGKETLGHGDRPMYVLDLIFIGVLKRSMSLAMGVKTLVDNKNMTCVRAMVRMQLDTLSRLLAYTYVDNPSDVAQQVMAGKPLNKFKCRDGKNLRDGYLIDRMTEQYPWVKNVYQYTSGYVHFSERQVFDSIQSIGSEGLETIEFGVTREDFGFPEDSWVEVVACFNEMLSIVRDVFTTYRDELDQIRGDT